MSAPALTTPELAMLVEVFRNHPGIAQAKLFGSRAKGTHAPGSDVDLALWGDFNPLGAEAVSAELEELPLPYRFDVQAISHITQQTLLEHIERVGRVIYVRQELGHSK